MSCGCVILYRVGNDGLVQIVQKLNLAGEDVGEIHEFADMDEAIAWLENNPLYNSGQAAFQVVELDEL